MKLRLVSHFRPMPRVTIVLVYALVLGQGALLSPLVASELNGRLETLRAWGDQATTAVQRRIPERPVRVNRTVPKVTPPNLTVAFGDRPSTESLARARVLPTALVPVGAEPSAAENAALARALESYAHGTDLATRFDRIEEYLREAANSPWRPAVAASLGALLAKSGYFTRAAGYWTDAWEKSKNAATPRERAVGEAAIAELLTQYVTFGNTPALEGLLSELEGRPIGGSAGSKIEAAREGLALLTYHHETATFSGTVALIALMDRVGTPTPASRRLVQQYAPSHAGMTLRDVRDLGAKAGLSLVMRHVPSAQDLPVPAIVHLRSNHFAAVMERTAGGFTVRDPALGGIVTLTANAVQDEMSGFVVVPAKDSTAGRDVSDEEASGAIGHCIPGLTWLDWWPGSPPGPGSPPSPPGPMCGGGGGPGGGGPGGSGGPPPGAGPSPGPDGMIGCVLDPLNASVALMDVPLRYAPPRGPEVAFTLRYSQRSTRLPQIPTSTHAGPQWSVDWMSWVTDNVTASGVPGHWADVLLRGFGVEQYNTFDGAQNWRSRATLVKVAHDPPRYERRLHDGSMEVYTLPDSGPSTPYRRVFLTQVIDRQGQALTFTYDASLRLVAVTDAIGQVTTLSYEDAIDPLRLTKVTDPFGRQATLAYDVNGRLQVVTDVIGMQSRVTYEADGFAQALTTPYGTTSFRRSAEINPSNAFRRIEATDPEGGTERIEFHFTSNTYGIPASVPAAEVPSGFDTWNQGLDKYNSFLWDKRAMAEAPGDPSRATVVHWLMRANMSYLPVAATLSRDIPHSIKRPLETRVWYRYQNQPSYNMVGEGTQPVEVGRKLESGTTQTTLATYNAQGMPTSKTDPLGRQTTYLYAANGIDLLEVRQVNGGSTDLLATYAGYNVLHLPATVTDGAGQTTTITYNGAGQPLTVTNAKNEVTTYAYQAGTGYLLSVTGPVANSTTAYGYDGYGRVNSVTEPDGYSVTMLYDALNRLTRRTYPDATYDETTYQRLDAVTARDRKGRLTRYFYDGLGRRTSMRDPLGRVLTQVWCACGALDALIDANGNKTTWERDGQNRVTREVRADGVTDTLYTYDATGRLKTVTDPKDQVTTHTYATDDSVLTTVYTNATIPTPGVTYTYDPIYPRVSTMMDGIGTTTYSYKVPGVLGAGQVASVDGPLTNDTIAYTYDQLGRVAERTINGAANAVTWTFDALGRVISETNVLGLFSYTYEGVTNRLATVTYPNNQTSTYSYLPNNQDHRLQTIHHKYPNGTTLSKFDYTYDAVGNILTWRQQADTTAVNWRYSYDAADQLTSAIKESTDPVPVIQKRYAYGYDPAGNRLFEQIDDHVMAASHDTLNRLTQHTPGGPLQFVGTVNEPASVAIAGQPATVDPTNTFRGLAPTINGTTTVSITATDPSGNMASRQYEVDVTGAPKTFVYDANGNMTSDGTRTFEWDARNQLVAIYATSKELRFSYNGGGVRVRVRQLAGQAVVADQTWVVCDGVPCESRDVASGATASRLLRHGRAAGSETQLELQDHLGSVVAIVGASGVVTSRREFEPFGARQASVSDTERDFAGLITYAEPDVTAAIFRAYSSTLGRWISEDPARVRGGINLYRYGDNNPINRVDIAGLWGVNAGGGVQGGVMAGFVGLNATAGGYVQGGPLYAKACGFVTICFRLGFGYYLGAGGVFSGGASWGGPGGGNCTVGAGADAGWGPGVGGSFGVGSGSAGGSSSTRGGFAGGFAAGLELCCTKEIACCQIGNEW